MHWKKTLKIPPEAKLSPEATDILLKLMCDSNERLGKNGVEEIKKHPFFKGIDWNNLRSMKAPYQPVVKSEDDCSRFDKFEEETPFYPIPDPTQIGKKRKDMNFPGYTFKKEVEEQKTKLVQALKELLNNKDLNSKERRPEKQNK